MIPRRILFVDVQAAGSAGNGILLEIAWKEKHSDAHSFLVMNTGEERIPPRVQRITGICDRDIEGGNCLHPLELKKLFLAACGFGSRGGPAILAAHHAIYEKRWLDWLTGEDLEFVCTREMARELVPDLLSGTLRAVAGLVGYSLGERRRALDHVLATEAIFNALSSGFSPVSVEKHARLSLPCRPGVYRFIDPCGTVLYVGKAKNLRSRVNSHFTGKQKGRHAELISRTCRVVHEETETALQAALAESALIARLSPQYNKAGRILEETLWYLTAEMDLITTEPKNGGFFGPFTERGVISEFVELISFIRNGANKWTFVENLPEGTDKSLVFSALTDLKVAVEKSSLLQYGLKLHMNRSAKNEKESELSQDIIDYEYIKRKVDDIAAVCCLLCRRAACHRLLLKSEVLWGKRGENSFVHKFVENSLTDLSNRSNLQITKVLMAEIRRIYREDRNTEIRTRFGTVIKGESLGYLLSTV